jgi:hypothetical protein
LEPNQCGQCAHFVRRTGLAASPCPRRYRASMLRYLYVVIAVFVVSTSSSFANDEEPLREKGISVHALPKRVAELKGSPWGLEVSYAPYLKPELNKPYLKSLEDVIGFIEKQDKSVIENGFWVVTTNPLAYDEEEITFQEAVKEELPKRGIALFWARGSELKDGFTRY